MELNKELESMIEKACNLQQRVNEEINNTTVSFCNYCSEQGWLCKIAETPFEERERLIASRDCLKDVEDILIHIQRMRGWHMINMHAAVNQLEESREILMEKVSEYEGRPLGVIQELNASFGNGRRDFVDEKRKSNSSFLHGCMEFLCNQGRWQRVIGAAAKVIAVSMSVSCTLQFCGTKLQSCTSRGSTMRSVPNNFQIDVLKGRG